MNRYQDIVGRISYWLFLANVVLLPYPQICLRYSIVIWFIVWLMEGRWLHTEHLKSQIYYFKPLIPVLLFGLWYIYKLLSGLWAGNMDAWHSQIERYLSFGLMIPVWLWGVSKHYDWQQAGRVFVISCMVAVPAYLLFLGGLYLHPEWVQHVPLNPHRPWIQHEDWWIFVGENMTHFKHRLFFCSVELLGAIVAWIVYRKRLAILIPALIITLSSIQLTLSRQAIITCAALLAIVLIFSLPQQYRLRYGIGIALVSLLLGGGLLTMHPRMQTFNFKALTDIRTIRYDHDVRLNIWGAALQHPHDYLEHGLGAGQSWVYLIDRYHELGLNHYAQVEYNCHNQYLEELLEGGIIGLVIFLLAWLSIPICAPPKAREFAWLFAVLFLFNMFTECIFGRFDGVAIWDIGMIELLVMQRQSSPSIAAQ